MHAHLAASWRLWAMGSLLLSLIVPLGLQTGALELVVRPVAGGEPLLILPLEPGERFTLQYNHSVDCAPIWEVHSVDRNGTIYLEEERFVMFGAGMGHWAGHGSLTSRGAYQVIERIHTAIGGFVLRVGGRAVDHAIVWRGQRLDLYPLAAGQAVVFEARPTGTLPRLWRRLAARPFYSAT